MVSSDRTGGSLSVNYIPGSGGKWDVPSEFAAAVTMASGTAYTSYSTQINGGGGVHGGWDGGRAQTCAR